MAEDPIDANTLRDILYVLFTDDDTPLDVGQGITATPRNVPALTINYGDPDIPVIGGITKGGSPFSLTIPQIQALPDPNKPATSAGGGVASSFPGKILSGSGTDYQVEIYPSGLQLDSEGNIAGRRTVSAKQLQIDPAESVPVDTWCIVTHNGNVVAGVNYFLQIPVWL